ncbi:flavodoxin [Priestia aryabhattai]|uniref:flavodoxin n=1 Tax=Bacillus sp. CBEL-1 TaxID=2502980 RepID=UPI000BA0AAC6|nr:flavodoxin [Bacillus sp. CBEL-1]OZT11765.1 flavodoxin [Priestia aryabhattai]TDB53060.1 flavodoxin [Bacillus sp. CBEL-1]
MAKILIGYASMSGNTEEIAYLLKHKIQSAGHEVHMEELELLDVQDLQAYDGILLGAYTWGNGDLPYEAEDFYDNLGEINLIGKKGATFGSGDRVYPEFCAAVDLLEERLKKCGADIVCTGLKIEMAPEMEEDIRACEAFAVTFLNELNISAY